MNMLGFAYAKTAELYDLIQSHLSEAGPNGNRGLHLRQISAQAERPITGIGLKSAFHP